MFVKLSEHAYQRFLASVECPPGTSRSIARDMIHAMWDAGCPYGGQKNPQNEMRLCTFIRAGTNVAIVGKRITGGIIITTIMTEEQARMSQEEVAAKKAGVMSGSGMRRGQSRQERRSRGYNLRTRKQYDRHLADYDGDDQ